jgi:oligopeptide/dipeptide ABC transporter ATP-binding protein
METDTADTGTGKELLELLGVSKQFHVRTGGRRARLSAVETVSLSVRQGTTLGIVGESGCGKSTLARVIVGLHLTDDGQMIFDGKQVLTHRRRSPAELKQMQMVFQDPSSALNPRATISESIGFPLQVQGESKAAIDERVAKVMRDVGLPAAYASHYPHQLSGGQRQRVNIARALALQPKLVVLDEAVSALDKSIQAQVLNLLTDLQEEYGLTYVFISHDLNVVRYISDDVAVMYLGQVVERGNAKELYDNPKHPYTQLLLSSVPTLNPADSTRDEPVDSAVGGADAKDTEIPSPIDPPSGCRFRTRCPFAMDICSQVAPAPVQLSEDRSVACHLYADAEADVQAVPA